MQDLLAEVNDEHDAAEAQQALERDREIKRIKDNVPTITARAMLTMVNISVPELKKTDKELARQLAADTGGKEQAFSARKTLVSCGELDAMRKLRGIVRNHVLYHYTQDFAGELKYLSTEAYFEFHPIITQYQQEFSQLLEQFMTVYQSTIVGAQLALGDSFDPRDYPSEDELRSKFKFDVQYLPIADAQHWALDVEQDVMEDLTTQLDTFMAERETQRMREIWENLKAPLANMVDRLDYIGAEDKKIFKGSLVDNVLKIVDVMRLANITGDSQMAAIQNKLTEALCSVTAESLREDDSLRRHVQKEAAQALRDTQKAIDSLPSIW
jgi:hypothetical protein